MTKPLALVALLALFAAPALAATPVPVEGTDLYRV